MPRLAIVRIDKLAVDDTEECVRTHVPMCSLARGHRSKHSFGKFFCSGAVEYMC